MKKKNMTEKIDHGKKAKKRIIKRKHINVTNPKIMEGSNIISITKDTAHETELDKGTREHKFRKEEKLADKKQAYRCKIKVYKHIGGRIHQQF